MNFAIIGGTHGNEVTGIEVINFLQDKKRSYKHSYKCFLANPKAYEIQKRYVDSDLNRAFGVNGASEGYEKQRSAELKSQIKGNFDCILDLHTTTTNMGLTLILTRNDEITAKLACLIQEQMPEVKLITTEEVNEEAPYTTAMCPSGIIVEVGLVPHNVKSFQYINDTLKIVEIALNSDLSTPVNYKEKVYYHTVKDLHFEKGYFVHPKVEYGNLQVLRKGDPLFISLDGDIINYESDQVVYPFFVNEAAYQETEIVMSLGEKRTNLEDFIQNNS